MESNVVAQDDEITYLERPVERAARETIEALNKMLTSNSSAVVSHAANIGTAVSQIVSATREKP